MDKQKISVFSIVLAAFFLIGVFAGFSVSMRVSGETSEYLAEYILLASDNENKSSHSFGQALINSFLFPVTVFILGFTVFGVALIPLAVAFRAFSLAFAITAFVRAFGNPGLLMAFGALGPQNLLSLPCLFLLSAQGMLSSLAVVRVFVGKAKKPGGFYGKHAFVKAMICFLVLAAAALLEIYLVPALFSAFAVNI